MPSASSMRTDSVTSRSRRLAGSPVCVSHMPDVGEQRVAVAELDGRDIDADTRHPPASSSLRGGTEQALRPSASIWPVLSASSMKTSGGTAPNSGWFQRDSASNATMCARSPRRRSAGRRGRARRPRAPSRGPSRAGGAVRAAAPSRRRRVGAVPRPWPSANRARCRRRGSAPSRPRHGPGRWRCRWTPSSCRRSRPA